MRSTPWIILMLCLVGAAPARPEPKPQTFRYYVQLIWGTNHQKPADVQFRPVGPKLKAELSKVFQWRQYWQAEYRELDVQSSKPSRVRLSPACEVEVELVSPEYRETRIYGKGILVTKSRRKLDCHSMAIHGGATEEGGSWFVVVREDKPVNGE